MNNYESGENTQNRFPVQAFQRSTFPTQYANQNIPIQKCYNNIGSINPGNQLMGITYQQIPAAPINISQFGQQQSQTQPTMMRPIMQTNQYMAQSQPPPSGQPQMLYNPHQLMVSQNHPPLSNQHQHLHNQQQHQQQQNCYFQPSIYMLPQQQQPPTHFPQPGQHHIYPQQPQHHHQQQLHHHQQTYPQTPHIQPQNCYSSMIPTQVGGGVGGYQHHTSQPHVPQITPQMLTPHQPPVSKPLTVVDPHQPSQQTPPLIAPHTTPSISAIISTTHTVTASTKTSAALEIINPDTNDKVDLSVYKHTTSKTIPNGVNKQVVNSTSTTQSLLLLPVKKSAPLLIESPTKREPLIIQEPPVCLTNSKLSLSQSPPYTTQLPLTLVTPAPIVVSIVSSIAIEDDHIAINNEYSEEEHEEMEDQNEDYEILEHDKSKPVTSEAEQTIETDYSSHTDTKLESIEDSMTIVHAIVPVANTAGDIAALLSSGVAVSNKSTVVRKTSLSKETKLPTRFIYSREVLLEIGRKECSKQKPSGLSKQIAYNEKIILDIPLNSVECLQVTTMKLPKSVKQPNHPSWRHSGVRSSASIGAMSSSSGTHSSVVSGGQRYINLGHTETPLSHAEDGYVTVRQRMAAGEEIQETEEHIRQIKAILNKIVPQNFDQCLNDLVSLKINTQEGMNCLVNELFLKAVKEEAYSVTFAKICSYLAQIKADVSENEIVTFRSVLLQKCQMMFTTPLEDQLEKVREDWMIKASGEKPKTKAMMENDVEEQVKKAKDCYYGNIRFIGELYLKGVLITKIICFCIDNLFTKNNDADSLICLCKLLETCGYKLETEQKGKDKLNESFNRLDSLLFNKDVESRVRYRIKDIIEMRCKNWSLRRVQQEQKIEPKTLEEIKQDKQLEQQQQYEYRYSAAVATSANDGHYHSLNNRRNCATIGGSGGVAGAVNAGNAVWTTPGDRRGSVPNPTRNSRSKIVPKELSVGTTETASLAPRNAGNWNKGSGVQTSKISNSIASDAPGQDSASAVTIPTGDQERRSMGKLSNMGIKQSRMWQRSSAHVTEATVVGGVGETLSVADNGALSTIVAVTMGSRDTSSSQNSSRSSSNSRHTTGTTAAVKESKLTAQPSQDCRVPLGVSSASGSSTIPASVVRPHLFRSLQSDADLSSVTLTASQFFDQYMQKQLVCKHSWQSYENKVVVVHSWLDFALENSLNSRKGLSRLLVHMLDGNVLERQDLLDAFSRLVNCLEEVLIDIGPTTWSSFADFFLGFIDPQRALPPLFHVINNVFDSDTVSTAFELKNAVLFYCSVWHLVTSLRRDVLKAYISCAEPASLESEQHELALIVRHNLSRALHILFVRQQISVAKYATWLQLHLEHTDFVDCDCRRFFCLVNWIFFYRQIQDCSDDEETSVICEYSRTLSTYSLYNDYFLALKIMNAESPISDEDLLRILWHLYRFKICDYKQLSAWYTSESQSPSPSDCCEQSTKCSLDSAFSDEESTLNLADFVTYCVNSRRTSAPEAAFSPSTMTASKSIITTNATVNLTLTSTPTITTSTTTAIAASDKDSLVLAVEPSSSSLLDNGNCIHDPAN